MVDALALGASGRKAVEVQVLSPAPNIKSHLTRWDFMFFDEEGLNMKEVGKTTVFPLEEILKLRRESCETSFLRHKR